MQVEKVARFIVSWLNEYCSNAGMQGFVVGVSGGIDSAVTSTLCAMTGLSVLALNMPIHQAKDQVSRAAMHIAWLESRFPNVKGKNVDLSLVFDAFCKALPSGIMDGLTKANTKARIRMTTLYAFAGHHKMLVAGTGNKVEDFGIGFFTKYGDGGVDLSPIADLTKTEVYELGKHLGVGRDILDAPPTDGLWEDNRSDEDQLQASYPEIEWAMEFDQKGGDTRNLTERQKMVLQRYRELRKANLHKMQPVPVAKIPPDLKSA